MTSKVPDYTANPAHLAEQYVIPVVEHWVGKRGTLRDDSAGNAAFDFTIDYVDGRRAVGDVWLDADQRLMAIWGDLFSQPNHHQIELEQGAGVWSLGLSHEAKGPRIRREVPDLIAVCRDLGRTTFDFQNEWLPPDAPPELRSAYTLGRSLGVEFMTRHDDEGVSPSQGIAYYFPRSEPPATMYRPNSLQEWIAGVFANPVGAKHIRKLLDAAADERHAIVVASTATHFSLDEQLATLGRGTPELVVPEGLTHVWALPRNIHAGVDRIVGLWTPFDGWSPIRC